MRWWIARTERALTERISAAPSEVRDFYIDLDNIKGLHPLVMAAPARRSRRTFAMLSGIRRVFEER